MKSFKIALLITAMFLGFGAKAMTTEDYQATTEDGLEIFEAHGSSQGSCYESDFLACRQDLLNYAKQKAQGQMNKKCKSLNKGVDQKVCNKSDCNPYFYPGFPGDNMNLPAQVSCWADCRFTCN